MRKISDFLGKPLISLANASFEGTIIGVLCERRLKTVEYLNILVKNDTLDEKKFITVRNVKNIADDAVTISNNLCIKTENDVDYAKYCADPIGCKVYSAAGELQGHISDIYISDTTKEISALIVDGAEVLPSAVASASCEIVVLYADGAKPVRKSAPRKVKKPANDAKVELLTEHSPVDETEPAATETDSFEIAPFSPEPQVVALEEVIAAPEPIMPTRLLGNYRFLLGRVVTSNIYDFRKQLIIKAGSLVTAETVLTAHKNNKLIELTLHSKA